MVEFNNNEIKIYYTKDNHKIIRWFLFGTIISIVVLILLFVLSGSTIYTIMFLAIIIFFLGMIFVLKKEEKQQILNVKINKENFEIHRGLDIIEYNFNDVISVTYNPKEAPRYNSILISIVNARNGKNEKHSHTIRGIRNYEFCNICNTIINNKKKGVPIDSLEKVYIDNHDEKAQE